MSTPARYSRLIVLSTTVAAWLLSTTAALLAAEPQRPEFTTLVAHWDAYADPEYLPFIREARPDVAQVGFYGAHFWSLAHTPHGKGYPAHFPVVGLEECGDWFEQLNAKLHAEKVKVVGHFNIKFLVGDPDGPEGPRGFFKFYRDLWNEQDLGPKPVADPFDLLEKNAAGEPILSQQYKIGGMNEYWGCLNNPHWRSVLKAWARRGIRRGVDGYMINYFYRHDCLCSHCQTAFKEYLRGRFSPAELRRRLEIEDLAAHQFKEIVAWHDPAQSTPLRREMLRFSQVANKRAFDEVFLEYGRSLKPDLIVGQWNHLGDFSQIAGDERCMLPGELWGRGEDYLWYSSGGAANYTDFAEGFLGDITLQARYVRGAFDDKPFTFGKYESTRIRAAIAELAANGGAPMGFYTRFTDPAARREIARYYNFLHRYDAVYRANRSHAEVLLVFPRSRVHEGDLAALATFKQLGRRLLEEHRLFDVLPDDLATAERRGAYKHVIEPVADGDESLDAASLSQFTAPKTVRVSASRPQAGQELTLHLVNYNRHEPPSKRSPGSGIADEKPIAMRGIKVDQVLPEGFRAASAEFSSPETPEPQRLEMEQTAGRVQFDVPELLIYGIVRVALEPIPAASSAAVSDKADAHGDKARPKVAAIVSVYGENSHADVIVSRLVETDTLDGRGPRYHLDLASLLVDQFVEQGKGNYRDKSRALMAGRPVRLSTTVEDALTLGTGKLAVDGVLLVLEHGDYPVSPIGSKLYPKRKYFDQIANIFRRCGKVVPVYIDKHLSDNWADAKAIYDTAQELKIPLMAGSSLPMTWRVPPVDTKRDMPLKEIVVISYHLLDVYGFHALELLQALVERRPGGEHGVRAVQCLTGDAVWEAGERGEFDLRLLEAALARQERPVGDQKLPLRQRAEKPVVFLIEYQDGLRAAVLTLNGAVAQWAAAWRYQDGSEASTLAWVQEVRPFAHFSNLLHGVEAMVETGKPAWPVERTLLTSGLLDALLTSKSQQEKRVETPWLAVPYRTEWNWQQPPLLPGMTLPTREH